MNTLRSFLKLKKWLVLLALGLLAACQQATETVDTTDEFGHRIRYERDKKNFAKQGRYERYDSEGKLSEVAQYERDTLHGERQLYYPDGLLESIETFAMGTHHGPYRKWRADGSKYIEQEYVSGQLEGWSLRYYPNGQLEEKVMLVRSEENGPFTEYYPDGQLKTEGTYVYHDDTATEHGELREYDSTGVLVRVADCTYGRCRTRK
jgi:antitoxin component YwqK of YwqJK toxin-antitoxin module